MIKFLLIPFLFIFGVKPHDEKDFKSSLTATGWHKENYCKSCGENIGHNEWMANSCNSCGAMRPDCWGVGGRSARYIWNGFRFRKQRRYPSNDLDRKWGQ